VTIEQPPTLREHGASTPDHPNTEQPSLAPGQDLAGPSLAPDLVRLLAFVLAGGFALSIVVLAGCSFSRPDPNPYGICHKVGTRLEERWESAISLVVGLLAGAALNGER